MAQKTHGSHLPPFDQSVNRPQPNKQLQNKNRVVEGGKQLDFSDLAADPVVRFQKNWDPWFAQFMCFVMPALFAKYCWG